MRVAYINFPQYVVHPGEVRPQVGLLVERPEADGALKLSIFPTFVPGVRDQVHLSLISTAASTTNVLLRMF